MTSQELLVALIGVAVAFYLFWPKPNRNRTRRADEQDDCISPCADDTVPTNGIVLDGSNIMFWGGDPSASVLARVVHALEAKGLAPIVIFDASAGYRLSDRFLNERALGRMINVGANRVYVVHKGVVADEVILDFATEHNLRIVTNDRYRDWAVQFPLVKKKGRLVKGDYKEGSIILQGL